MKVKLIWSKYYGDLSDASGEGIIYHKNKLTYWYRYIPYTINVKTLTKILLEDLNES